MKTTVPIKQAGPQKWILIDAKDQVLGRLATRVATILRGKNKPEFTPHMDTGDGVIVINAEKVKLTGNKFFDKRYYKHTGYPGGIKSITYNKLVERKPEFPIYKAVKGMLPKNRLGRKLLKKLRVYAGENHKHTAQKPVKLEEL